jgi:hypothetical protein
MAGRTQVRPAWGVETHAVVPYVQGKGGLAVSPVPDAVLALRYHIDPQWIEKLENPRDVFVVAMNRSFIATRGAPAAPGRLPCSFRS